MRFTIAILTVLTALTTSVMADSMSVGDDCAQDGQNIFLSDWNSAYGRYNVFPRAGCQDPSDVPDLTELCMDWPNNRAHFFFVGQSKRCMVKGDVQGPFIPGPLCTASWCCVSAWNEVPCTW
ncbi:hypothetical protein DFP72DRAFT_828961 [Ephemerocybe angulata]|uniref:Secreted protein n=1 Tax=Ephemerocybe angulata TaxID=980116 RepID=A0A8H6H9V5_9AGAR|nr:hypothetical protein DFP72DRAFT_828961 [Tulosesus angulatus]